jgi:hypothetical protein
LQGEWKFVHSPLFSKEKEMGFSEVKELGLDDLINFGKYKGKTVHQVLHMDASYLVWAHDKIEWFKLKEGIHAEAVDKAYKERMEYELDRIDWGVDLYDFMD